MLINQFDEVFKDLGTSDYITGLTETHEKWSGSCRQIQLYAEIKMFPGFFDDIVFIISCLTKNKRY